MRRIPGTGRMVALAAFVALTACSGMPPEDRVAAPAARPVEPAPAPTVTPDEPAGPSAQSALLATYYQRLESTLSSRGLLRTDGGGPDTPFTDTQLARNFIRIALFDEYVMVNGTMRAQETPSTLRRWEQPVRMQVLFGDSISAARQATDRRTVASYAARLSRASGLPISMVGGNANYHVIFLNEDERLDYGDDLRALLPGITDDTVRAITNLPRDQLCVVVAFSEGGAATYSRAVAIIRAEHPDLMRLACIHEEIAQGLGLANDSPAARPSIFNDDEEFALLTRHDELLLQMLYDRRLRPGMTPEQATPIAQQIAREILGVGGA